MTDLVWHYTDGPGLISIVSGHTLWATASGYLNDEQEVVLGYQRIVDEVRRGLEALPRRPRALVEQVLAESEHRYSGPSPSSFYVLSAAQAPDLLAMWRCYGGRGESYAIGLDSAVALPALAEADSPCLLPAHTGAVRRRGWSPVRYTEQEHRRLAAAVLDGLPAELKALRARAGDEPPSRQMVAEELAETLDDLEQALILVKHEGFVDERETRYCVVLADDDDAVRRGLVHFRSTPYGITPYLRLTGPDPEGDPAAVLTSQPRPLPIRSVMISPSRNGEAAEHSARTLLRDHGYDVEVSRSPIPFRE